MCPEASEAALRTKLFASGMAALVPEEEVACDSTGRMLLAGLFCVEHKKDRDRLIVDRRPQNSTEHRLQWARLPHGVLFCRLRLEPHQVARGGGDDISCYFYCLKCPTEKVARSCFGRVVTGNEAVRFGGLAHRRYRVGLTVWPMGDLNAVDVAQVTHEKILAQHGGLQDHEVLRYGGPFPRGPVYQGVYVDDHVVVGVCDRSVADDPGALHDTALLDSGVAAYAAAGLPVAAEKRFRLQTEFTAWGTEVSSERGTAGAPLERRLQMFHLVCLVLASPAGN
jgi:hypothetical protein